MKRKILFIVLLVFALSFTFVACEEVQHQHTFDTEWSSDSVNHWHKATCCDTDEADGKAPHSFSPVIEGNIERCDVCGYSRNVIDNPNPNPEPKPHEHSYATELSADETNHWYAATCEHESEVKGLSKHEYFDGICKQCGWWSSATDVLLANLSKSDVWSYPVFFNNVRVNSVNLLSDGIEHADIVVSGELKLSLSPIGISGYGYIEADGCAYKAVVDYNVVYACHDDTFFRFDLQDLLKQNGVDVKGLLDELNANTQQIREYIDQIKNATANLPIDGVIVDTLFESLVKVDEEKSTDSLTVYVADVELLRQLNLTLATITVDQYVNAFLAQLDGTPLGVLLGNTIDGLPDRVYSLLNNPIWQTTTELWEKDFRLDDLFNQLNGLIAEYYPDDKVNTIDELVETLGIDLSDIAKRFGVNIKKLTVKQLVESCSLFSPETLWNMAQEDDSTKISAEAISNQVKEYTQAYADKTVYDIIVAGNGEYVADDVKALVENVADWLEENVSIEFYVDADKTLQQVIIDVDGQTLTLKRNGKLQQDYSDIIDYIYENYVTSKFDI